MTIEAKQSRANALQCMIRGGDGVSPSRRARSGWRVALRTPPFPCLRAMADEPRLREQIVERHFGLDVVEVGVAHGAAGGDHPVPQFTLLFFHIFDKAFPIVRF